MGGSRSQRSDAAIAPVRHASGPGAGTEAAIREAVSILETGGVIAIPTDTVYGLAASIHRPEALARLYTVKGRPDDRPLPVLLAAVKMIELVADQPTKRLEALVDRFWPGGLTVALPALPRLEVPLRAGDGTVGVRVPDHPVTEALLRATGGALAVTSANPSGRPPALTAGEVVATLGQRIDLVIDAGQAPGGQASTVIGFDRGRLALYRQGAISWPALRRAWRELGGEVVGPGPGTVR